MPEHEPLNTFGWDANDPQALSSFLDYLSNKRQLLGLGEPTHGVQDFPRWRNRIFQMLVQEHGYRSVAIESDVLAGLNVNNFVLGGSGTLDEVMQEGFSHSLAVV